MRYRALDANGDYSFGKSQGNFLINSPEAVGQAVQTRLRLLKGEWFLDVTEGMPWSTEVVGVRTRATRDQAVKTRVLGTQGVTGIASYASQVTGRGFSVQMTIDTLYGQVTVSEVL